jgi:hypothetical protein
VKKKKSFTTLTPVQQQHDQQRIGRKPELLFIDAGSGRKNLQRAIPGKQTLINQL